MSKRSGPESWKKQIVTRHRNAHGEKIKARIIETLVQSIEIVKSKDAIYFSSFSKDQEFELLLRDELRKARIRRLPS